jgi:hypothetical protein
MSTATCCYYKKPSTKIDFNYDNTNIALSFLEVSTNYTYNNTNMDISFTGQVLNIVIPPAYTKEDTNYVNNAYNNTNIQNEFI